MPQIWELDTHFLRNELSELLISKKTTNSYLLPMIKFELSSKNLNVRKLIIFNCKLESSPVFKDFSNEIGGDIKECFFNRIKIVSMFGSDA